MIAHQIYSYIRREGRMDEFQPASELFPSQELADAHLAELLEAPQGLRYEICQSEASLEQIETWLAQGISEESCKTK